MVDVFENYDLNFIESTGPCEFCGDSFPLGTLIQHETKCNPLITSYAPGAFDFETSSEGSLDNDDEQSDINQHIIAENSSSINDQSSTSEIRQETSTSEDSNKTTGAFAQNATVDTSSQRTTNDNPTVSRPKSAAPSFVEALNEDDPSIFTLKSSEVLKMSKNEKIPNSKKSAPVENIEESLFRCFTKNREETCKDFESKSYEEEIILSSDEDADETIEQFWERAQKILNKRAANIQKQSKRNEEVYFYKENLNV